MRSRESRRTPRARSTSGSTPSARATSSGRPASTPAAPSPSVSRASGVQHWRPCAAKSIKPSQRTKRRLLLASRLRLRQSSRRQAISGASRSPLGNSRRQQRCRQSSSAKRCGSQLAPRSHRPVVWTSAASSTTSCGCRRLLLRPPRSPPGGAPHRRAARLSRPHSRRMGCRRLAAEAASASSRKACRRHCSARARERRRACASSCRGSGGSPARASCPASPSLSPRHPRPTALGPAWSSLMSEAWTRSRSMSMRPPRRARPPTHHLARPPRRSPRGQPCQ